MELFPRSEIELGEADNERSELRAIPQHVGKERRIDLILSFKSEEDREELLEILCTRGKRRANGDVEIFWPPIEDSELRLI